MFRLTLPLFFLGIFFVDSPSLMGQYPVGQSAPYRNRNQATNASPSTPNQSAVPPRNDQAASGPLVHITNKNKFTIPFTINMNEGQIVEIQLHVSRDAGATWKIYARQQPGNTKFEFEAPEPGQYWMALRSVDRSGRSYPGGRLQPGLSIVVDKKKPELAFEVRADAAGRLVANWKATDQHLAPDSMIIRYRTAGETQAKWHEVPVDASKFISGSTTFHDRIAFWPDRSTGQSLQVEATIKDRAGNGMTVTEWPILQRKLNGASDLAAQRPRRPANARLSNQANHGLQNLNPAHRQLTQMASHAPRDPNAPPVPSDWDPQVDGLPDAPPNAQANNSDSEPSVSIPWNPNQQTELNGPGYPGDEDPMAKGNLVVSESSTLPKTDVNPKGFHRIPASTASQNRSDSAITKNVASKRDASDGSSVLAQPNGAPPNNYSQLLESAISTNSKKFRLNYSVDAGDPSAIKEVVLWATRDGGQTWGRIGVDNNNESPFPVEVDEPGLYGFRIVVVLNDGLRSRAPSRGDTADILVHVDLDAPQARITSVPYGKNDNVGKLIINWHAADERLALRPIALAYGTRRDGPWTTIENGLRNTGSYAWDIDATIPDRLYLQLQVRDEAGNITTILTDRAIDVSGLIPRGRIHGIDPIR